MTRKANFSEECYWLKFNNLGLMWVMALKFHTSVRKRLKLKVRKFLELISTFVEVTEEKLVGRGGAFNPSLPPPLTPSWKGLTILNFKIPLPEQFRISKIRSKIRQSIQDDIDMIVIVTDGRLNDAPGRQILDPIEKNVMRKQNSFEIVF